MNVRNMIAAVTSIVVVVFATPVGANGSHAYSAQQIFEGVFFGHGIVAEQLPEIWHGDALIPFRGKVGSTEYGKTLHAVEAKIERRDPTYFAQLQRDMTSGDPGLVEHAMQITHRELAALAPNKSAYASAGKVSGDGTTAIKLVLDPSFAIIENVIVLNADCTNIQCPPLGASAFNEDRAAALIASRLQSKS